MTKEHRAKISAALVGKKHSQERIEKNRQARLKNPNRYWLGKRRDPDIIKKMNDALRGKPAWNREVLTA